MSAGPLHLVPGRTLQKCTLGDVFERDKMTAIVYYDPGKPSAFSSLAKLQPAIKETKGKFVPLTKTQALLELQDAYTLHKPGRKHFPRNPYTVTNVMEVWESDLLDAQKSVNSIIITSIY